MFEWKFVLLCFVFASAYVEAKDVETKSTTQKTPELKTRFFGLENIFGQIFQGPNNPGFGGNFQHSLGYHNQQNPQAQHNWHNIQTPNQAQSNLDQSLQSTPLYPQGNFNSQNNVVPGANENVQTQQFPNQQQIFNQLSNMDQYPSQQGNFNMGNFNPNVNSGTIDDIPSQNGINGNWNQSPGNQFQNQNVGNQMGSQNQFGMENQGFQNLNAGNQNAGNQFGTQNQNGNQGFENPNAGSQNAGNQFGTQNQNGNQGFENPNAGSQNAGNQFGTQNQNGNQGFQNPNAGNQNAGNQFDTQNQNGNQGFENPNAGNQNAGNQFGTQNQNGNQGFQNQSPRDDDYNPVAILGKPVPIPITTSIPDSIVFTDGCDTPTQKQCVQDCQSTTEFNPVCGSNKVTYFNPGRFICARNCGIDVFVQRAGRC